MSTDKDHIYLTGQERWYLNSKFPLYWDKTIEPKAMQALIDKGLVTEHSDMFRNKYYKLTPLGEGIKQWNQ